MTDLLLDTMSLEERRSTLGASAVLWAGLSGVTVDDDRWLALSGAPSVQYNAALVHGDGSVVDATVLDVLEAGAPAVVMVAGPAVHEVGRLRARRWKPIGSAALMHLDLTARSDFERVPAARRLNAEDHRAARELIGEVYGVGPDLAAVAISGVAAGLDGHELWGAFDAAGRLVSCLATARVGETITVWSMATISRARRRGYGAAALTTALASAASQGVTSSLLSSSAQGEALYRTLGYRELERWQQWSRPRWALARA